MRRIWLSLAVAALMGIAQGQEDARAGKVRELIELTGALDRITPVFGAAFDRAARVVGCDTVGKMRKEFGREQLLAVVVPLYAKHFDDATLDAALAFFRSPAGKNYVAAQELGYDDATAAANAWVEDLVKRTGGERETKRLAAAKRCKEYYDQMRMWQMIRKQAPKDLQEMEGPLEDGGTMPFTKIETDPWGGKYVLRFEGKKPRVVCPGPDGVEGTEDDVAYPDR